MTTTNALFDQLWDNAAASGERFEPGRIHQLPEAAQRYLNWAIAPGTMVANAVRLTMAGEIRLNKWLPFEADQVIHRDHGFVWAARTRLYGLPVSGYDRLVDGQGEMRWRLLGLLPVMSAADANITRSAAGRWIGESFWLPSMLLASDVVWIDATGSGIKAVRNILGGREQVEFTLSPTGALLNVRLDRWGNPGGGAHRRVSFGGFTAGPKNFDGYTIPTRLRGGWYFGTDTFETEGEFIRAEVSSARFK